MGRGGQIAMSFPDCTTILSVGHRTELEAFHTRQLVLEWHPEGAHLVQADSLTWTFRRSARFLARLLNPRQPRTRISRIKSA